MEPIPRKIELEKLVAFWNVSNFHPKTKIHNQDFDLIKDNLIKNCSNSSDFIRNYLSSQNKPALDKKFHPNLLAEPYCGNLSNAKIFILGLNPGFDNATYFCHENEILRKALLELVPYHSKYFSLPKTTYMEMPSVKMMMSFIENDVLPKVNRGDAILIVLRKGKVLETEIAGLKEIENKIVIYKGSGECQRASLSANSRGGKAMLNFLLNE